MVDIRTSMLGVTNNASFSSPNPNGGIDISLHKESWVAKLIGGTPEQVQDLIQNFYGLAEKNLSNKFYAINDEVKRNEEDSSKSSGGVDVLHLSSLSEEDICRLKSNAENGWPLPGATVSMIS